MSDFGSIIGGWASSALIKRGWSVNKSRKTTMFISALCVIPVYYAAQTTELWLAVGLIGLALAAHSAWSANLFTLTTDMFPRQVVGSVVGIGSMLGAVGGLFGATIGGFLLQTTGSYVSLFIFAGCAYLIAFIGIQLLSPKLKSITLEKII
jgi:ACS family hexuronate transporter-like MFS transporter